MKYSVYSVFILCLYTATWAQKPFNQDGNNPNLDFSLGNFRFWRLSHGDRDNPYTNNGALASANSHTLVEQYGNNWDGNTGAGNLKRVPDGLSRVLRLGAPAGGGYGSPKSYAMTYDITVQAGYPILFFRLAAIMDKSHPGAENTHYKFSIKNAQGSYLLPQPCGGLELAPRGTTVSGSNVITNPSIAYNNIPEIGAIAYQPWQSVALDLSNYVGQTITLAYEHYDCYTGHHGSYTYLSAAMRSPYDTFYFCRGASATTIKPFQPDFQSYRWHTGATTDSLVINNPKDGERYACTLTSYNGCTVTFTYVLKEVSTLAGFHYTNGNQCNQIQFSDQSASNGGPIQKWQWDFGSPSSGTANYDTIPNPLFTYPYPGNYIVTLTVTDTLGCSHTISKTVAVSPEGTIAKIRLPYPSCREDTLSIEDETANAQSRIWLLNGQLLEDTAKIWRRYFPYAGIQEVTLITRGSNGCPDTAVQSFRVWERPEATMVIMPYTHTAPITDPEFILRGEADDAARYVWDFGYNNATGEGQSIRFRYPAELAEYILMLTVYDRNGCSDTAVETLRVMPPDFMIPNAFSPNGDGQNDAFQIVNITNQQLKELSIYNKFGQRVFHTLRPGQGWDGTFNGMPCDIGTYYYLFRYTLPGKEEEYSLKGDVLLLR